MSFYHTCPDLSRPQRLGRSVWVVHIGHIEAHSGDRNKLFAPLPSGGAGGGPKLNSDPGIITSLTAMLSSFPGEQRNIPLWK